MRWLSRDRAGKALLAIWAPVACTILAFFMVNHVVAMPSPEGGASAARLVSLGSADGPLLVHVIYRDCSCTNGLVRHLVERGPMADAEEVVLYVGDGPHAVELEGRGFRVRRISRATLRDEYGLDAAPYLVVDDGAARYAGGYYELPATVNPRDASIFERVRRGEEVTPLPLYGCAVSTELQAELDPLGVRY